jgi:hypothetical protein
VSDVAVDNSLEPAANQLHSSYDKAGESKKSVSAHMPCKTLNEVVQLNEFIHVKPMPLKLFLKV